MKEKLDILKEGNVIDDTTYDFALKSYEIMKERQIVSRDDLLDMFITHLAMATQRIKNGEIASCDIESMTALIKDSAGLDVFNKAIALWRELSIYSPVEYPLEEQTFIYLHLCNTIAGLN